MAADLRRALRRLARDRPPGATLRSRFSPRGVRRSLAVLAVAVVVGGGAYVAAASSGDSVPLADVPPSTMATTPESGPTPTTAQHYAPPGLTSRFISIWRLPTEESTRRELARTVAAPAAIDALFAVPRAGRVEKNAYVPPPRFRNCVRNLDTSYDCVFFYRGGKLTFHVEGSERAGYMCTRVVFEPGEFEPYAWN